MTDYTNAYFTGNGIITQDPNPTYYSNYIVIRDINTDAIIGQYTVPKGLPAFDSLGLCATLLTVVNAINPPWKNNCAIYCMAGDPQPQSHWQI